MKHVIIIFFTITTIFAKAQITKQEIYIYDTEQIPISNLNLYYTISSDTISLKTDLNGKLTITRNENEIVRLIINNNDYSYFNEAFKISSKPKYIFLDKEVSLNEIIITAKKENISRSFGTTTLNIDDSPVFQNSTFQDAIMLIPEINIVNGNVKILGKNKTLYLMNGRKTNRKISDLQINQIEKIEVISNPSAKYQANYDSVINVILMKIENNGWYFNLNSTTFINKVSSYFNSVDVGMNINKWSINSSIKYNFDNGLVYDNGWQNYIDRFEDYYTRSDSKKQYLETATSVNYSINENNNIGVDFSFGRTPQNNTKTSTESNFKYFDIDQNDTIRSNSESKTEDVFINASIYYSLSNEKSNLNSYISLIQSNQDFTNSISSVNHNNTLLKQNIFSNNDNNTLIFNTDYAYEFNDNNKLETGAKLSIFNGKYGIDATNFNTPISSTLFDFNENVYAIYGVYKLNINKFSFSTGLRYEYYDRDVTFNNLQKSNTNQGNIFPSAYIGYKSEDKKNTISLSYTIKIQRPNFNDITPLSTI